MEKAKTEVLRKVEIETFNEIKKGDLFYSSNCKEGNLYEAMSDGVDLPDAQEAGKVECVAVVITPKEGFEILQKSDAKNLKNIMIAEKNLKNVVAEFTKAMNIIFKFSIEVFNVEDGTKDWVQKYKDAHGKLKEMNQG